MKCLVRWIPLRIRVRSRKTPSYLKWNTFLQRAWSREFLLEHGSFAGVVAVCCSVLQCIAEMWHGSFAGEISKCTCDMCTPMICAHQSLTLKNIAGGLGGIFQKIRKLKKYSSWVFVKTFSDLYFDRSHWKCYNRTKTHDAKDCHCLSCRSLSAKGPTILGFFCGKRPCEDKASYASSQPCFYPKSRQTGNSQILVSNSGKKFGPRKEFSVLAEFGGAGYFQWKLVCLRALRTCLFSHCSFSHCLFNHCLSSNCLFSLY